MELFLSSFDLCRFLKPKVFSACDFSIGIIVKSFLVGTQAAQTLFVIYIRDSIALRFEPFKKMYENGSKIALNSTFSKGFK